MRLKTLDLRGFGPLRGVVDLETGAGTLTLLLEPNESGKSTLAAAIAAALYGLDSNRTRHRNRMTPLEHYRPWGGGAYALDLTLEAGGRELRIERDFERGTAVVSEAGRDISAEFRQGKTLRVGEMLTGLSEAQFGLSVFVPQGVVAWKDASDLAEALQRAADTRGGESTAAAAISVLQSALDQYEGVRVQRGKVETEIKRCDEAAAVAARKLECLEQGREDLDAALGELQRVKAEEGRAGLVRQVLRMRRQATEFGYERTAHEADRKRREEVRVLREKIAAEPELAHFDFGLRQKLEAARRRHEIVLSRMSGSLESLQALREKLGSTRERLDTIGLKRVPSADELTDLGVARQAWAELEAQRQRFLADREREEQKLQESGCDPERTSQLIARFGKLAESNRLMISERHKRQIEDDEEAAQLHERLAAARAELDELDGERRRRRTNGFVLVAGALVLELSGWFAARAFGFPPWAGLVPGVLVLALGLSRVLGAARWRSSLEAGARVRIEEHEARLDQLHQNQAADDARLEDLARRARTTPEELGSSYHEWVKIQPLVSGMEVIEERLKRLEDDEDSLRNRIAGLGEILDEIPELSELDGLFRKLSAARGLGDELASGEEEVRKIEAERERDIEEAQEGEIGIRLLLAEPGVVLEPDATLEQGYEAFFQRAEEATALHAIRDVQIPELERQLATDQQRVVREQRIQEMERVLEQDRPRLVNELAGLGEEGRTLMATLDEPLSEEELQSGLRELESEDARRHEYSASELTDVRSFIHEYERDAPALREEIEECADASRRARDFQAAVEMARDTLGGLAQQTHRVWSQELARHTNEALLAMGSDIGQVEFDDALKLRLVQRGQRMDARAAHDALSTGAYDMVHLACRLALARFLGLGGEHLPLILDDPFAHCDDTRTLAGMRLLLDSIAPEHQVILLACQRSRYDWVAGQVSGSHRLVPLSLEARV